MILGGHDNEEYFVPVLYEEVSDQYICSFCADDFSLSQLHACYGGNHLPFIVRKTRRMIKHLRAEECLICGESVARSLDQ